MGILISKIHKKILLFTILNLLILNGSFGQTPTLKLKYFGQKERLSNSFITSIAQDSVGYLWIGTINGLNRFDGEKFKTYYSVKEDSTTLPSININKIYTDYKGNVWISTTNGFCRYNEKKDNFIRYKFDQRYNEADIFNPTNIASNKYGEIFVSDKGVIFHLDTAKNTFIPYISITPGDISKFIIDDKNNFWIAGMNGGGLTFYDTKSKKSYKYKVDAQDESERIASNEIKDIVFKDNVLFLATLGAGLISFDTSTNKFRRHPANLPNANHVVDLFVDNHNRLWTIDYTGLKYYDTVEEMFYSYYPDTHNSLKNIPFSIFQDNQDNYWIMHYGGGVGISVVSKGFDVIDNSNDNYWHLSTPNVSDINEDENGNLWISTSNPGIDIFNWQIGKIQYLRYDPDDKYSLGAGTVNTIFKDHKNQIWVGTYEGGLQRYNKSNGTFISYRHDEGNVYSIANNDIRSVDEDDEGFFWVVTHGKGIDKFNPKTERFNNYNKYNSNLSNPWTNQVVCSKNGDTWVGSVWGLNRLSKGKSIFENYFFLYGDKSTISNSKINVIFESEDTTVWIGTDNGLDKYIRESNSFYRFDEVLANVTVNSIEEDDNGNLWLGTLTGLICFNPISNKVTVFDELDGIQANEFNIQASYKNYEGYMYFGGIEGVTAFHPNRLNFNTHKPPVVITALKVLNKEILPDENNSILKDQISQTKYFEIDFSDKIISFEFTALNFNNHRRNQYAYKLEGFENEWTYLKENTPVTYTNLLSGFYTFRVKASNNDGFWNEEGTSVSFRVLPPWYLTLFAKLSYIVLIVFVFWMILIYRTRKLTKQQLLLTREVNQKTKELRFSNKELKNQADHLDKMNKLLKDKQDKVESQKEELKTQAEELKKSNKELIDLNNTKDKLFSIIAHDLLNPFNSILGMTEVLNSSYNDLENDEQMELVDNIHASSNRLFNLLQNLLLWARSQTNSVKFQQENFVVLDAIEESTHYLHDQLNAKSIQFKIEGNNHLTAFGDVDMFKTVVRNLVSNAIKFTRKGGHIVIISKLLDKDVVVSVIDNGLGISQEISDNLFTDNIKGTKGTEGERGTGLGLLICKEFVERNYGTITVTSEKGKGSKFSFTIPESKW